jgi:benzoyl-CoA reductase/2-hydroxyglutaryl-CoA dehydratase subunit BcrC/BadD/HgdB
MEDPPISGLDALLVSQAALSMDVGAFNRACEELISELASRAAQGISAYAFHGPRVLVAGSPSPMGFAKIHHVIETSGLRVVADESCTGIRYYRDLVDESAADLDAMLDAVADRYFSIDCSCFSPNTERVENILGLVDTYRVDGVVHSILLFCHTYNVEAGVIDRALKKKRVPTLKVVTDYAYEDLERIRVRLEAFREQFAACEA